MASPLEEMKRLHEQDRKEWFDLLAAVALFKMGKITQEEAERKDAEYQERHRQRLLKGKSLALDIVSSLDDEEIIKHIKDWGEKE